LKKIKQTHKHQHTWHNIYTNS